MIGAFVLAALGMAGLEQQFFPSSDRPELLAEVQMPEGTSIEATDAVAAKVESWLKQQPEAKIVTTYVGAGAPRFFIAYNPELPDPSFAKIIVLTADDTARDRLKLRFRERIAAGFAPEARVRVSQLVFGPYSHFPVAFRLMGPDLATLRDIADKVQAVMRANPNTRQVNQDWGERAPTLHFVLDQQRLQLIGLTPSEAGEQLQLLLTGTPVTAIRENIRTVDLVARGAGRSGSIRPGSATSPSPTATAALSPWPRSAMSKCAPRIPCCGGATASPPHGAERHRRKPAAAAGLGRDPTGAGAGHRSIARRLPYRARRQYRGIAQGQCGARPDLPDHDRADAPGAGGAGALAVGDGHGDPDRPARAGRHRADPAALPQPFGFNAILGLFGLSGILMRNTLILMGQIHTNQAEGLDPYHAVVEATVQRARPVVLTALAAVLAFIPLTQSVFGARWPIR